MEMPADAPGYYANVFSYCGAVANCTVAAADGSGTTLQSFGQCDCSIQNDLRGGGQKPAQINYLPLSQINSTQTNIASGTSV
jgi:hypothetical protein